MSDSLLKPAHYRPEARFEAVLVTMDNAEEIASKFRGEVKYFYEPVSKVVSIPTLNGVKGFSVAPWHESDQLLIVDKQTGRADKVSQRAFDAKYVWDEEE